MLQLSGTAPRGGSRQVCVRGRHQQIYICLSVLDNEMVVVKSMKYDVWNSIEILIWHNISSVMNVIYIHRHIWNVKLACSIILNWTVLACWSDTKTFSLRYSKFWQTLVLKSVQHKFGPDEQTGSHIWLEPIRARGWALNNTAEHLWGIYEVSDFGLLFGEISFCRCVRPRVSVVPVQDVCSSTALWRLVSPLSYSDSVKMPFCHQLPDGQ